MKSHTVMLSLLAAILVIAGLGYAQQGGAASTVAKAAVPPSSSAAAAVKPKAATKGINPDQAYKANCSRCHTAPHKFSDRAMATIMRHMRVRANMTEEETKAILQYLTE